MTTKLIDIINQCKTFLLDASGVIYTDYSPIPGASIAIKKMQEKGKVFLVTNNAFQDPLTIENTLKKIGIMIPETHIISSAHGLKYDSTINDLIKNKNIYIFGSKESYFYILNAKCKSIVNSIEKADCIILTSSFKDHTDTFLTPLLSYLEQNPDIPIICCNPDQFVMTKQGLKPVIGYFVTQMQESLKNPLYWMGKPYSNFSQVVAKILKEKNIDLDTSCCFFDDNLKNVSQLKQDLNILGCWVKDTGISKNLRKKATKKQTDFIISSLSE